MSEKNYMTQDEFVEHLREGVKKAGSVEKFCATLKGRGHMILAPHYVSSVLANAESPGADLVKAMGYQKQTLYVKRAKIKEETEER
jgi:hypothetical protein